MLKNSNTKSSINRIAKALQIAGFILFVVLSVALKDRDSSNGWQTVGFFIYYLYLLVFLEIIKFLTREKTIHLSQENYQMPPVSQSNNGNNIAYTGENNLNAQTMTVSPQPTNRFGKILKFTQGAVLAIILLVVGVTVLLGGVTGGEFVILMMVISLFPVVLILSIFNLFGYYRQRRKQPHAQNGILAKIMAMLSVLIIGYVLLVFINFFV